MNLFEINDNLRFSLRAEEITAFLRPFSELVIFHEKYREAYERLMRLVIALPRGSLIYLVGPTGAGKTALLRTLMNRFMLTELSESSTAEIAGGKLASPPIYIEAPSPQRHIFDWRDFDIRFLRKLQEPGVWYKADLDLELKRLQEGITKTNNSRKLPADWLLFQCLEDSLKAWSPPFACIDEVQNLIKMPMTAASFEDQMDIPKSIANLSKVTLIMAGTYKMKNLIFEGDEITRRSRIVHLGRYLNRGSEWEHFQDYHGALIENSPLPLDFDPLQHSRYFYTYSVGCPGTLKDWYYIANCETMLHDRDRVRLEDFEATAFDKKQLVVLMKEINGFESYFNSCPEEEIIEAFWRGDKTNTGSGQKSDEDEPAQEKPRRPRRCRKPGEMNPTRIPLNQEPTDDNA